MEQPDEEEPRFHDAWMDRCTSSSLSSSSYSTEMIVESRNMAPIQIVDTSIDEYSGGGETTAAVRIVHPNTAGGDNNNNNNLLVEEEDCLLQHQNAAEQGESCTLTETVPIEDDDDDDHPDHVMCVEDEGRTRLLRNSTPKNKNSNRNGSGANVSHNNNNNNNNNNGKRGGGVPLVGAVNRDCHGNGSHRNHHKKSNNNNNDKKRNRVVLHHSDSTFIEQAIQGSACLMKNDEFSIRRRRRRPPLLECDSNNLDACLGAVICFSIFLAWLITLSGIASSDPPPPPPPPPPLVVPQGITPTVGGGREGGGGRDSSFPSIEKPTGIDSIPVQSPAPTSGPGTVPSSTAPKTATTTTTTTERLRMFESLSEIVTPHMVMDDERLPDFIRPERAFGHVIALDGNGDRFVAAMHGPSNNQHSDENYSLFGCYQLFRWAVSTHEWIWERTLYSDESSSSAAAAAATTQTAAVATATLSTLDIRENQAVSINGNGERIAFIQDGEAFIDFGPSSAAMGQGVKRFGPSNSNSYEVQWNVISVALSPWGDTLALLLLSNDDSQPSILEIFHETKKGITDNNNNINNNSNWELVTQTALSASAMGGFLSFGFESGVDLLAVGTYHESYDGTVSETIDVFSAINGVTGTWFPLGNPKLVANGLLHPSKDEQASADVGGSTFCLSLDGGALAIGSRNGLQNRVVILRLDIGTGEWDAYGTNHVLVGVSEQSHFGAEIRFDQMGKRLFVGAPNPKVGGIGQVFVYEYDTKSNTWIELSQPIQGDDQFGSSFAIDQSGNRVIVGLPLYTDSSSFDGQVTTLSKGRMALGGVGSYHLVEN